MQEQAIQELGSLIHSGGPLLPPDLWTVWNIEPSIWIPLLLSIFIYSLGSHNIWQRAGTGRGINSRQWMCFVGAVLVLVVALMSPIDALSESLFSAHMVQHLLLILMAAPLLVMSDFQLALLWALPRRRAKALVSGFSQSRSLSWSWRVLSNPVFVWLLFTIVIWLWHAPVFYEAALRDEVIHILEHLIYLITAILFWWILMKHTRPDHVHYAMTIPYLFLSVLQSGILGALMTFTSRPWYSFYATSETPWGFTPLQDQQLAGLIMWVPGGAVFTLLTIGYFAAWLRALEQHSMRLPRHKSLQTPQDPKEKARVI